MQSMLITLLMLLMSLSHLCCCDSCTATDVVTDAAAVVVVGKDCCRGALVGAVVVGFAYRTIYQWTHTNVRVHTRTHKHSLLIEVIL